MSRLIYALLKEPQPSENPTPDLGEVLRLAHQQFAALRQIDDEAREKVEAARKLGICPDMLLVEVRQPYPDHVAMYEAVMRAVYGEKFAPWRDERMVDIWE
jgi:hypothetical protein